MRFSNIVSIAFTLAATVSAVPVYKPTADSQGLAARGEEIYAREFATIEKRVKSSKIPITINKKLTKGKIAQNKQEDAKELAQKAVNQAECASGEIIYGWHDENTEDPLNHFTVKPDGCVGKSHGLIHVHENGSWSQGKKGEENSGDGNIKKRDE